VERYKWKDTRYKVQGVIAESSVGRIRHAMPPSDVKI